ncbi:MAG: aminopeptidase [Firmicutes bacterium]|nr:aminopeptidase [Bacillota bacterium]
MQGLAKAAHTVLMQCMGAKPGEILCIVYDEPKSAIAQAILDIAAKEGLEAVTVQMNVRSRDGEEPPAPVASAMANSDIVLCITSRSLSHTKARRDANLAGARIASLPGITEDMLIRTMQADYSEVARLGQAISKVLQGATSVHVESATGTNLHIPFEGRPIMYESGLLHSPGDFGNLPAGEVALAPLEGGTHGTLVIDGSMSGAGKLTEPLTVVIEDGLATSITGGTAAARLHSLLEPLGPDAYNIAELGIGTNPAAMITGAVLEDEKVLGTIHIALGNSISMGGNVDVPIHLDGIVRNPTVVTNTGTVILKDGVMQIS